MSAEAKKPTIGRIVLYRSRTGLYTVPAIVAATEDTLAQSGIAAWVRSGRTAGTPPLSSALHVHLVVCTPGIPRCGMNMPKEALALMHEDVMPSENMAGTYQEWDVAFDGGDQDVEQEPCSWRWPPFVPTSTPVGTGLTRDVVMSLVDALDPHGTNEALKLWARQWTNGLD